MALPTHSSFLLRLCPPWLQRLVGERFMLALGAPMDALAIRSGESVMQRFPGVVDDSSLGVIGRERRIRRGPAEEPENYARRLRLWWDSHRGRGGPYALLDQLYAYTQGWVSAQMDVVYQSGTRRWIDTDGVITRDSIVWGGHGQPAIEGMPVTAAANALAGDTSIYFGFHTSEFPAAGPYQVRVWSTGNPTGEVVTATRYDDDAMRIHFSPPLSSGYSSPRVSRYSPQWAHVWLFFHLPDSIEVGVDYLATSDGDHIITSDGDHLVATRTITPDEITPDESAIFTALPREWSAAHIPYITVVLLWSTRRLWNYPQPVPTWAEWGASGALWGDSPVMLRAE